MEYLKVKGYEGLSAVRSEEDLTAEGHLPHPIGMGERDRGLGEAALGEAHRRGRRRRRGVLVAEGARLGHPEQAERQEVVWFAGNKRWPGQ
jgi:hypothetical protein